MPTVTFDTTDLDGFGLKVPTVNFTKFGIQLPPVNPYHIDFDLN